MKESTSYKVHGLRLPNDKFIISVPANCFQLIEQKHLRIFLLKRDVPIASIIIWVYHPSLPILVSLSGKLMSIHPGRQTI